MFHFGMFEQGYFECLCTQFFLFLNLKKLYFIGYAIIVVLNFLPFPPSLSTPNSLRQSPQHCSCPWVMSISSLAAPPPILYFTSPRLFYDNSQSPHLFTHSPTPLSHPATIKTLSVSMILSLFLFVLSLIFRFNC